MTWKPLFVALKACAAAAALVVVAAAGALWRLSEGPVSLRPLLPHVGPVLPVAEYGLRAEYRDVVVAWRGRGHPLAIRIVDLQLRDGDGGPVAGFATADVALRTSALLRGEFEPVRIELSRPRLPRRSHPPSGTPTTAGPGELFRVLERAHDAAPFLERVVIRDAVTGALGIPEVDVRRTASGMTGSFRVTSGAGIARGEILYDSASGSGTLTAALEDFGLGRAPESPAGEPSDSALSGTVSAAFDRGSDRLAIGDTALTLGGTGLAVSGAEIVFGETVTVRGRIAAERAPTPIPDVFWPSGLSPDARTRLAAYLRDAGKLSADVVVRLDLTGQVDTAEFDLAAGPGRFAAPGGTPLALESFAATGRFDRAPPGLRIDRATLAVGDARISVRDATVTLGEAAAVEARIEAAQVPLPALAALWPPEAAAGARAWVFANLGDGVIDSAAATVAARLGPGPGVTLAGQASLKGYTVRYLEGLPPVRDVDATMTFEGDRLGFAIRSGALGALEVREAEVRIDGIGTPDEIMSVSVDVGGPVSDALALLDNPRLDLLSELARDPEARPRPHEVGGAHRTRLDFRFPLLDALRLADTEISAESEISALTAPRIFGDLSLSDGAFDLAFGDGVLTAGGTAEVAGQPLRMDWRETFSGARSRTVSGSLAVDEELAGKLDIPPFLEGAADARFVFRRDGESGPAGLEVSLDVGDAGLVLPGLGRIKEPGSPGTAFLAFVSERDGIGELSEVTLRTADLEGAARRAQDGSWRIASDFGNTSFSGTVRQDEAGFPSVEISGKGLDAAPLIKKIGADDTAETPPFRMTGTFDRLWIDSGQPLSKARVVLDRASGSWRRIWLDATLPDGGEAIRVSLTPAAGGHELDVELGDTGRFLAALGIETTMEGGKLALRARKADGPSTSWKGAAETGPFRLTRAPVLARLLKLMSLAGLLTAFQSEGLPFDSAEIPFELKDGIMTISDARVVGTRMSLTASGELDFAGNSASLTGMLVPASLINRILAGIPILGPVASGGDDLGVFAATYEAKGPIADPEISINPLAILTPGIVRKALGNLLKPSAPEPQQDVKPP